MTSRFASSVEIEINHSCNRRCSYCPNSILERKSQGEIALTLFTRLLAELRELQYTGIISYNFYNEPLLHSNLPEIVRMTRASLQHSSIEIYTNGTLLNLDKFRLLLQAGISRFIVTQHEADSKHRFAQTYQQLTASEKQRVEYRPYTQLALTNRGGILKHLGAKGLALTPCHIPQLVTTITVTGNVLPCFEDFHEDLVMGNLNSQSLWEIWNSQKYIDFRNLLRLGQRHRFKPCSGCNRTEALSPESVPQRCSQLLPQL